MTEVISVVRRFNRSYTQRIGALEDSFLGTGMPLASARLLFEIGLEPGTAQALRARLGLDSGYLSRLLRSLERDGLVAVVPDPADRRRRQVSLTEAGQARWNELERRSDERARLLVDPLTERQAQRLARALSEADLLVRAATVTFREARPAQGAARQAVGQYFAEIGRRFGFEPDGEADRDAALLVPPAGVFLLAISDGAAVACGGLHTIGDGVGELKRMWVHEAWRGAGLGSRLLRELEDRARGLGHAVVRLDTNGALTEAISMYQRAGYRPVDRYNDNSWATHFFEKSLADLPLRRKRTWEEGGPGVETRVAGILLAAGEGSRLGQPKALVELGGQTLAQRGIAMLRAGGTDPLLLVTGAARASVAGARTVRNLDWRTGMGSSLVAGLHAIEIAEAEAPGAARIVAAVIALADQPLVGPRAVQRLIDAFAGGAPVAVAAYDGRPRNPVLIGREHWAAAAGMATGDMGARPFLRAHPELVTLVECADTGSPLDIDTPEDLARVAALATTARDTGQGATRQRAGEASERARSD